MGLTARKLAISAALALLATPSASAQLMDAVPHASYYIAVEEFYSGAYRQAERDIRRKRGVRIGQTNWIDSICFHAILGEVLYQQGRNAEALAEFDQACQVFLAYPNWLLQVKYQSTIGAGLRPDPNRSRRVPSWGQSSRTFVIGQFADTEQVLSGDLDAGRVAQQGGVVRVPMYWRVNVVEVLRTTALAIRRRNELLGPLAPNDPISKELSATLARGNLAPANHWSGAWIDLLRGLAQAGMGKLDEADMLLGRSLVVDGRFDHPLTCVALLEQGRIAMVKGDTKRASQFLAEAGFSAYYFEDWDVLTESVLNGWINHMATNAPGVYPPLESIAAYAQASRLQHIAAKLRLAQAESLLWLNQVAAGAAIVEDVGRRLGDMRNGLPGIHQVYLQAAVQLLQGKIEAGGDTLVRALAAQATASRRNFQILRTSQMYDSRMASPRLAVEYYSSLLADPSPADWVRNPLDAMAVLQTGNDAAFDRWFLAALERKDAALALEIAERAKRRRYLATRPFGGRLLALRAILESPVTELSQEALLQRQRILGSFPEYQALVDAGLKIRDQLLAGPILASNPAETKTLGTLYETWGRNAIERQHLLVQLAVRRLPTACEFPPWHTTAELQQSLGKDETLVVFHSAAGNMYGFVVTKSEVRIWQLPDANRLRAGLSGLLKALGNYGANRQLSIAELKSDAWRESSKAACATIFEGARLDVSKTTALIIVPDDMLWYLPFEVLTPDAADTEKTLSDLFPIRYGPTAALAISKSRPLRRPQHTGIVANDLKFGSDTTDRDALVQELKDVLSGPLVLPDPSPEPANVVAPLIDHLIALDDVGATTEIGEAASLLPRSRGSGKDALSAWIVLPIGGPEQIILTGVATEAEQGLKPAKRSSSRASTARQVQPGSEVFQSLCNLMSGGARTVLITRWRTGGRTNFDLVREFAAELANGPAAEAWQRACLLAREAPIDVSREPRLKRSDETGEMPTADHPFFWAGYLLVDTGPRPADAPELPKADANAAAAKGKEVPPPAKADDAAGTAPTAGPAKPGDAEAKPIPEEPKKDAD
jgi:hypothetical protein